LPTVTIPLLSAPPTIDGTIKDAEWQSAATLDGLSKLDALGAPTERTRAWIGYDKDGLLIAVRCWMQAGARPVANTFEGGDSTLTLSQARLQDGDARSVNQSVMSRPHPRAPPFVSK
jgi:hypothetical protein